MKPDFRAALQKREMDLSARANELRAALQKREPRLVASLGGAEYSDNAIRFSFWGIPRAISLPQWVARDAQGAPLPSFLQTLLLYYFFTADGAPLTGRWVSFAELPNGRVYHSAFQGYSGDEIAGAFALDLEAFRRACENAGGIRCELGDAAYRFDALPRMPLLLVYWLGDEDFPSSCKALFDASAAHYLPAEACAIVGSMLKQKIIKGRKDA